MKNKTKKWPTFDETFKYIKLSLKLLGLPIDKPPNTILFCALLSIILGVMLGELTFIADQLQKVVNIIQLSYLVPCIGISLLAVVKISYMYFKRDKLQKLIAEAKKLHTAIEMDPNKVDIAIDDILLVKAVTKYYSIVNVSLTIAYDLNVPAIILQEYLETNHVRFILKYPVKVPFPVDNWFSWTIVYTHAVMCGFCIIWFLTTADLLFCNLTCQACVNFAVICNELENLPINDEAAIRETVIRHQNLIKFSQEIENVFTGPNFVNVCLQSLMICTLGFHMTISKATNIPSLIVFLLSTLLQIFLMSLYGEKLIYESGRVSHSAFLSKWYKMNEKCKKDIYMIRERAMRPQALTAYKFSVICYASFVKIISTAWSYFTILKTVYNPDHQEAAE
uniref:Odorant receptor n=1 Tax=Conopomorpha sinensis TaxID=940481 RepID=A0A3S7SGM8_9NEOP|nr:putative odorant receptor 12 [Conopomorpha sinensis]